MAGKKKEYSDGAYGCLFFIIFLIVASVINGSFGKSNTSTSTTNQPSINSPQFPFDDPDNDGYYDYMDSYTERNAPFYDPGDNYVPEPDEFDLHSPSNQLSSSIILTGCVDNPKGLNVRSGPDLTFPIIDTLVFEECVSLYGRSENSMWGMTITGWVWLNYLDIDGSITNLPIIIGESSIIPTSLCDCSYNRYDCKDFTDNDAQLCFDYCFRLIERDIHVLDADVDGYACEPFP